MADVTKDESSTEVPQKPRDDSAVRRNSSSRPPRRHTGGGGGLYRKKVCRFCENRLELDYKKVETLQRFVSEQGKILPRRITGTCSKHQRSLTTAIKRARVLALLPFATR